MRRINCVETLKIPSTFLSLCGLLQMQKLTKVNITKVILNSTLNAFVIVFITLNINNGIKQKDTETLNWLTCVLIPMVNYMVKWCSLLINKSCLVSLFKLLQSDIFNTHSEELNQHIQLVYKASEIILRYFFVAMTIFLMFFCVLPFVTNIRMVIPPPFDMGPYEIPYKIFHFLITAYMAANSACFDVFYMSLMAIDVAQLNILEARLSNAFDHAKDEQSKMERYPKFENLNLIMDRILRECVTLHQTIIQFVEKLNVLLSFPLFVQYTCGCFVICNTILQMTIMGETEISNIIGMCGYSSITFGQMTAYHWLGNEIIYKSNKIIESCYLSNWYNMSIARRRTLILLMERAKRPLVIELYSLTLISLDSLTVIVRWAYSVFALIKARYN